MMHKARRHKVSEVQTAEELACKLSQYSWTLCAGFRLGDLLYLNDATSGDGAQEYAVVRVPEGANGLSQRLVVEQAEQVESITASWMEERQLAELAYRYSNGEGLCDPWLTRIDIEPTQVHGRCRLCA